MLVVMTAASVHAGGLIAYEVGTADVGLASAGYNARAQDASTVFTNPAGMTRLDGTQFLASGQVLYGNTEFSIDSGTSAVWSGRTGGCPAAERSSATAYHPSSGSGLRSPATLAPP